MEGLECAGGRATGRVSGTALQRVRAAIPPKSFELRLREARAAIAHLNELGVTGINDITPPEQLPVYHALKQRGELTVRVYARPTLDKWDDLTAVGIPHGFGDDWLRIGGLKGFVDGIQGNSTARFYEPQLHSGKRGEWRDSTNTAATSGPGSGMEPAGNMLKNLTGARKIYSRIMGIFGVLFVPFVHIYFYYLLRRDEHETFLLVLTCFPLFQLLLTFSKAVNKDVFMLEYQIAGWLPLVLVAADIAMFDCLKFNFIPNRCFGFTVIAVYASVTTIMWLQSKRGLFFFVPKACLSIWTVKAIPRNQRLGLVCSKCMTAENDGSHHHEPFGFDDGDFVRTPCNHIFHTRCLKPLVMSRYSCPSCSRYLLPHEEWA